MSNDFEFDSLIKKMAAEYRPELPSPGLVWWRAQILRKQAEKERIERPFAIMRLVAVAVGLLFLAALWMSQTEGIRAELGRMSALPFVPLLLAGAVIGAVCIGLMWWTASEA
jgi:hypothetical protein